MHTTATDSCTSPRHDARRRRRRRPRTPNESASSISSLLWTTTSPGRRRRVCVVSHHHPTIVTVLTTIALLSSPSSFLLHSVSAQTETCVYESTVCDGPGGKFRPLGGCIDYVLCDQSPIGTSPTVGEPIGFGACVTGLIFDPIIQGCNWESQVPPCELVACLPTALPTKMPTGDPTEDPTMTPTRSPNFTLRPTVKGSEHPTAPPTKEPTDSPVFTEPPTLRPTRAHTFFEPLEAARSAIEDFVLISHSSSGVPYPSIKYTFDGLLEAVLEMATSGVPYATGRYTFYLGNEEENLEYGWANLAAFLANAMTETIKADACDERNVQEVAGRYAVSNSCGQHGRSYQHEVCDDYDNENGGGAVFECDVDVDMVSVASDTSRMVRAPPPFRCGPKEGNDQYTAYEFTGYWDVAAGKENIDVPYSNQVGRTDVEGCCWWGRGVLATRGTCDIGKLNYYLGARAKREGREARFPDIDFCANPQAACSSAAVGTEDIRWITGMFEWMERVQTYSKQDRPTNKQWTYIEQLQNFVNAGGVTDPGVDGDAFIDAVSGIVTRRCHASDGNCRNNDGGGGGSSESRSATYVHLEEERRNNFRTILENVRLTYAPTLKPTRKPTVKPTRRPTTRPVMPPGNDGGEDGSGDGNSGGNGNGNSNSNGSGSSSSPPKNAPAPSFTISTQVPKAPPSPPSGGGQPPAVATTPWPTSSDDEVVIVIPSVEGSSARRRTIGRILLVACVTSFWMSNFAFDSR